MKIRSTALVLTLVATLTACTRTDRQGIVDFGCTLLQEHQSLCITLRESISQTVDIIKESNHVRQSQDPSRGE